MGEELSAHIPLDKMLWRPGGSITRCRYNNFIKVSRQCIVASTMIRIIYEKWFAICSVLLIQIKNVFQFMAFHICTAYIVDGIFKVIGQKQL